MFKILRQDSGSRARTGIIETPHGFIETPAYAIVGTWGEVRCVNSEDLAAARTELVIANTYHLWRTMGDEELSFYPGLHAAMDWKGPLMTDSGGFQVFSFGAARQFGIGKVGKRNIVDNGLEDDPFGGVRVSESGVSFADNGEEVYLDPELSIKIQEQLGADITFAFDEPTSPLHDYEYTKSAMDRTHRWAKRCLEAKSSGQLLYGVVQGGSFRDLREESARAVGGMEFDGIGIGGAFGDSFGSEKSETINELEWTIPFLPEHKPRHLLGIGRIEDVFSGVEAGIDTFDCVVPTREARHGALWTRGGRFDIKKGDYAVNKRPIDESCDCPVCGNGVSRSELRALFKDKNPEAPRLATIHNVYFFNDLMRKIRQSILDNDFAGFKKDFTGNAG